MTQATLTTSAFAEQWKIQHTAEFVRAGGHKTVALQFPDGLLAEAPRVAAAVSELCPEGTKVGRRTVFVSREDAAAELQSRDSCAASCAACAQVAVLADSAYNPESVDEVAAAHIGASCIVHYGRSALTANTTTPVLHVFPECPLDVPACAAAIQQSCRQEAQSAGADRLAVIFLDQSLLQHVPALTQALQGSHEQGWHLCIAQPSAAPGVHTTADAHSSHISAQGVGTRCEAVGYMWHVHLEHTRPALCCWVGVEQCSTLQALQMCLSACPFVRVHVDMSTGDLLTPVQHGLSDGCLQLVKRRRFLVEKARSAALLGILLGTGGSPDLNQATANLRALVRAAGKHSYTVVIGKPSPHKLANFPEVEVWVQLSDPLGAILDSRDYLSPLITPQEAVLALTGGMLTADTQIVLGLQPLLDTHLASRTEARLDTGDGDERALATLDTHTLMPGAGKQLGQAQRGVEYLQMRTWKGVDAPVAGAESKAPSAAVEGLIGRAAGYVNET